MGGCWVLAADDRILLHMDEFIDAMRSEIVFLDDLDDYTWQQVSFAIGQKQNASQVRSDVVRAALVSYSFAYQRIVCFYKREPWSLTQGDPEEIIEELAARTEAPEEPLTRKLYFLAVGGYVAKTMTAHLTKQMFMVFSCFVSLLLMLDAWGLIMKAFSGTSLACFSFCCFRKVLLSTRMFSMSSHGLGQDTVARNQRKSWCS